MYIIFRNMRTPQKTKKRGFTIIELLVALSIGSIVLGTTSFVIANGLQQIRSIKYMERLHSNTVHTINEIRYLVLQAETLTEDSDTQLSVRIRDGATYATSIISLVSEQMQIDGVTVTDDTVRVTSLNFDVIGGSVQIHLTLEAGSVVSPRTYSVTTTIAQRN